MLLMELHIQRNATSSHTMSLAHEGNPEITTAAGNLPQFQDKEMNSPVSPDDATITSPSAAFGKGWERTAGTAVVDQSHLIPMTGEIKVTKKSEIVSYCLMCELHVGSAQIRHRPHWSWTVQLHARAAAKPAHPGIP